jgi:hypothetical protein
VVPSRVPKDWTSREEWCSGNILDLYSEVHGEIPTTLRKETFWQNIIWNVKFIARKEDVRVWNGFNWLRTGSSGGLL